MLIEADTHIHTVASTHAYSTVLEIAAEAASKGLKAAAITDHTPASTDGPHVWHFHNLHKALPRKICGVNIIFGAESSIISYEGEIDFPHNECAALDWIIASIHRDRLAQSNSAAITEMYLRLAENNDIDVIGHCASPMYMFDYVKCLKKFKEYDRLVEINESTILWKNARENYREIIAVCKKYEIPVVVNTDAHFCKIVGDVTESEKLLDELDFPKELIINSDWDRLKERIERKHGRIFAD